MLFFFLILIILLLSYSIILIALILIHLAYNVCIIDLQFILRQVYNIFKLEHYIIILISLRRA